jgi:hypothetical protein
MTDKVHVEREVLDNGFKSFLDVTELVCSVRVDGVDVPPRLQAK